MTSSNIDIFQCEKESIFFQKCIEKLIFSRKSFPKTILELGSGEGYPVIEALKSLDYELRPTIYGYEICTNSYKKLQQNIKESKMQDFYIVYNKPFFETKLPISDFLISNPPYLPHESETISYPNLSGGLEGNSVSKALLEMKIRNSMLILSSYSNPKGLIAYAKSIGFKVIDYFITDISLEKYSKEPEVLKQIYKLEKSGKAFLLDKEHYRIAGVLFSLDSFGVDKSRVFLEDFLQKL